MTLDHITIFYLFSCLTTETGKYVKEKNKMNKFSYIEMQQSW